MELVTRVLATTSEISLKGGNRMWFERTLTANVRSAVADLPLARVERPSWRVLLSFSEPVPFPEVARRLATVFGLGAIMPVALAGGSLEEIEAGLAGVLDGCEARSFAVRCLRSDKSFPLRSPEVESRLGRIVGAHTGWPVDLRHPELTLHLLVDERGLFAWTRRLAGPGGLPTGVGGRAVCLISGGIDSPVAAWMMMKRGMRLDFVHFHSLPRTDRASLDKVEALVETLVRYQGPARLTAVPLLAIQEEIAARCPAEVRVLLYRRFMLRLAERVARRARVDALITGESLGQVASQTIENLRAVDAVAGLPVLRPLIGLDKTEIIDLGRRIGTYETSILPHTDCCSFLMPERPATRSTAWELGKAEEAIDVRAAVRAALAGAEKRRIDRPAPWPELAAPVEAAS
jgi:thiamine biosynthesis protein ThiI